MSDTRTIAQIEQDLADRRRRLAEDLAQLVGEVHPSAVKARAISAAKSGWRDALADAKAQAKHGLAWVKDQFVDEQGRINRRNLAIAAASVAGFVTLMIVSHRRES
ncbi:MAG: DUF3618 domain-containing protein [Propionibacteriaceae bacterium]|jgi:hypothetical protein|nr:DUF3618 domain-containing protein [Propionibacteriaceae bacterium]